MKASMVRVNDRGEVIVSVSVPVQRFRAVHGALMLSTQGDDIDQMVTRKRLAILKVFGIAAIVMIVLSLLLASTIAGPVRRLADSAEHVRRRTDPRRDPRFLRARRRDRPPVARAARHDRRALQPHRRHRALRRRRRTRTEEPADLDALGRGGRCRWRAPTTAGRGCSR